MTRRCLGGGVVVTPQLSIFILPVKHCLSIYFLHLSPPRSSACHFLSTIVYNGLFLTKVISLVTVVKHHVFHKTLLVLRTLLSIPLDMLGMIKGKVAPCWYCLIRMDDHNDHLKVLECLDKLIVNHLYDNGLQSFQEVSNTLHLEVK